MRRILVVGLSRMKLFFKRRFGIPRSILVVILFSGLVCWVVNLTGCACFRRTAKKALSISNLKETAKQVLAISTKELEDSRDKAIVKIVDYDYATCYQNVTDTLIGIGSYIYAKKEDLIAVYISQTDTTPAGVFFKQIDKDKTQVEIVSPAADTKEYLAENIFSVLVGQ